MTKNKSSDKPGIPKYLEPYVHYKIVFSIVVMLIVGVLIFYFSFSKTNSLYYSILNEIGNAIIITALVSSTIGWFFRKQFALIEEEKEKLQKQIQKDKEESERALEEERRKFNDEKEEIFREQLNTQLETLRKDVLSQTKQIADDAVCFDALQTANVDRFYRSRDEASEDIKNAILQKGITKIKMIGISLNDFMRDENQELHKAWIAIKEFVEKDTPPVGSNNLDIQLLIIDPRSEGAYLRGKAEGTEGLDTRLPHDVGDAMRDLLELEKLCGKTNNTNTKRKVILEAKVYRTSPILHLIWTPHTTFVQTYHFRPRHSKGHIPVIKYHNTGDKECMHQELEFHFNWLWDKGSETVHNHIEMFSIGSDDAIREAYIKNIYYKYEESKQRIISLIENTKSMLWIKGISLHSFLSHGEMYDALANACKRGVNVRVLLLNPREEQARLRSFREYLISHPNALLNNYDNSSIKNERLYLDTTGSVKFIKNQLMRRIGENASFETKLFNSSTEAFLLITDNSVLVEQYHYGNLVEDSNKENQIDEVILGGDVPVIEYGCIDRDKLISKEKDPYNLFKDNFDHTFKYYAIGIDEFK